MKTFFNSCIRLMSGGSDIGIRQRVFRLVLSASLVTFFLMGALALYSIFMIRGEIRDQSAELGGYAAEFAGKTAENQIRERLQEVARMRAQSIDAALSEVSDSVKLLSETMSLVLKAPDSNAPRALPDPRRRAIQSGEAYIHYGRTLRENGMTPALEREIGVAANVADFLVPVAKLYSQTESSFFVGSRRGYMICVDNIPGGGTVPMTEDFLTKYDPTERPWYKDTKGPFFHDVYIGAEGRPSLTCTVSYDDADGFAGVAAITVSMDSILRAVEKTAVGRTGFSVMVDGNGKVMISPKKEGTLSWSADAPDLRKSENQGLAAAVRAMTKGGDGLHMVEIDGEEYFLAFAPMKSAPWSFCTLISKKEVIGPAEEARQNILARMGDFEKSIRRLFTTLALAAALLFIAIAVAISRSSSREADRFVKPILALSDGVRDIAGGNLDKKLSIATGDEIEQLANSFNSMTDELKTYIENLSRATAEKERVAAELSVATGIQAGMLPNIFPPYPERKEFDIFASMNPAKEVGGDFYDFYLVDDTHLAVTIADVSGKGVPAALFMVIAKTVLKNCVMMTNGVKNLSEAVEKANGQLCQGNEESMFVTVFLGVLDIESGEFTFVNGGHNPPLIRANGKFAYLALNKSCMLGAMEGVKYRAQSLVMQPGDMLFLYTDGVTEAQNTAGGMYSEARLLDMLNREPDGRDAKGVLAAVRKSVADYAGDAEQFDDITMLGLIYKGK